MTTLRNVVTRSAAAIVDALENARTQHQLGGLPMLAAPVVVPRQERTRLARIAELLRTALLRLRGDDPWPGDVPRPPHFDDLLSSEPRNLPPLGACRFDALYDPASGALSFVEVQAGDPSGAPWVDGIVAALSSVHVLEPWMKHADHLIPAHLRHVQRTYREVWRGQDDPLVAFINEDGSFVRSDHELWAHLFRRHGVRAVCADPRAFTWDGAHAHLDGHTVDLVIRDSHDELTISPGPDATRPLRSALQAGLPRFNPFADVWFDDKTCFVDLWHHADRFPAEERELIRRHIPRTERVTPDLTEYLRQHREDWVLKPADGYGGFGIVVGRDVDDSRWSAALEEALRKRTVAQFYVDVPRVAVARTRAHDVEWRDQHLTVSLWCHGGEFSGAYARAGDGKVVNVHQGGGIGPVVFTDEW
ncbi:MAG: hypothetical protein AB2A00_06840 [Myxococcota bacterium]